MQGTGREIATGERADAEPDTFVSRRDAQRRQTEGERAAEDLWAASERAHNARREADNRAAWCCEYHRAQAERHRRNLGALVAHHETMAERLQADERSKA